MVDLDISMKGRKKKSSVYELFLNQNRYKTYQSFRRYLRKKALRVLQEAGIEVPDGYQVHHKDHNESNSNIENLVVLDAESHRRLHEEEGYD